MKLQQKLFFGDTV